MNKEATEMGRVTLRAYVTGFVLSLAFTLTAYLLVVHHLVSGNVLVLLITILALAQFLTQLIFFLHLGREKGTRWKLLIFAFMVLVVAILVLGSLWIMYNLNYHMSLQQMYQYMNSQGDGI